MYNNHKTVHISHDSQEDDVDEEIAPLILNLWKLDIEVQTSIYDKDHDLVWINFPITSAAEKFINIVYAHSHEEEHKDIHLRMLNQDGWEFYITPKFLTNWQFYFSMTVKFPISDLEFVMNQVEDEL